MLTAPVDMITLFTSCAVS